ncbi:MAG: acetyltransferase [Planctomycetota bacterium]|jgi:sugar O-acyltransferase (sialic acid O-acetyltransferase NeuD family)
MKENIILVGGGGHCKSCIDVIEAESKFKVTGIVDKEEKRGQKVSGYEIIACDEDLPELVKDCKYFLITIGEIKGADKRAEKFEYLKRLGATFPTIVSPSAYVSMSASVDEGTIIMHRALVNTGAAIGKNCIVNTGAIIEHDVRIGNHCNISTGVVVNGECSVGERTFIGSNSTTLNNITVAKSTIIGTGSSVIKSINVSGTYVGNPASELGENA